MLSKSQARLFFLGGTALFSAIFIALTVNTMGTIPAQTKSEHLTDSVKRGKMIWDKNNCMGCHTILGEGAYYAPELTRAYPRRGEAWLKEFLKDPQAMYPGKRKMVQYNFSEENISDVIAFLKWISEMDLNGFPPKPSLNLTPPTSHNLPGNTPAKFKEICVSCHSIMGSGGNVGPSLDGVGKKYDIDYLTKWLKDPQSVKPGTAMPKLSLNEKEISELVSFLAGLK